MNFNIKIDDKGTWDTWNLVPSSRPYVAPPEVRTNYIDITGRHGNLDYTDNYGEAKFGRRTGQWDFYVASKEKWTEIYSDILNFCNGTKRKIILDDDKDHYYIGRISVNEWKSEKAFSRIVLNYDILPYKYTNSVFEYSDEHDWMWDDLFDNVIFYGYVKATEIGTWRTLINPLGTYAEMEIHTNGEMKMILNGFFYRLNSGETKRYLLPPGDNHVCFKGVGGDTIVSIHYKIEGRSL